MAHDTTLKVSKRLFPEIQSTETLLKYNIKYFLTPEENFPAVLIYMKRHIGHVIKTL